MIWATICLYIALGTTFIVIGPDRIGQTMYNLAKKISENKFGWLILTAAFCECGSDSCVHCGCEKHNAFLTRTPVVVSFPPAVGHTTLITLTGYAYGMQGFPIAALGSLFGSATTFVVLRALFSTRLREWSESNQKWRALETVVVSCILFVKSITQHDISRHQAAKGLPLIMLIRASPLPPWVYSNTLFAVS